jgi:hypothetical protein
MSIDMSMNGPPSTPQKSLLFGNLSSFDYFEKFENSLNLKYLNSTPPKATLWTDVLDFGPYNKYLNQVTGIRVPSILESSNFDVPCLEGFGTLQLGSFVIEPVFCKTAFMPNLWSSSLESQLRDIQKLAHSLAKCCHRFIEVQFKANAGTAYGAFTVHNPTGKTIALASQPIQEEFNAKIAELNKVYVQKVNSEALTAFRKVYIQLCQELAVLHNSVKLARMEQIKEMLNGIPLSYASKDMFLNYWFCSSQLFLAFDHQLNKSLKSFQQHSVELAAKHMAKAQLLQKAKDDLMDVELSKATIESIVGEKVKSLLNKSNKASISGNEKPGVRPHSRPPVKAKSPSKKQDISLLEGIQKVGKTQKTVVLKNSMKGKQPSKAKEPQKTVPPKKKVGFKNLPK